MQTIGELIGDKIIVKKPKEAGRLYNKSKLGKTVKNNILQLDLLEGVFLLGEKKITLLQDNIEVDFQKLVKIAVEHVPRFEIKYLVFRDLRKKGYPVRLCEERRGVDFYIGKQKKDGKISGKTCFISAFSERNTVAIDETKHLIDTVAEKNGDLWFAIVDEEGDITYYDVALVDVRGKMRGHVFPRITSVFLEDRVVIFDEKIAESLMRKEFFGKPFGDGLQLSMVEALYLMGKDVIEVQNIDTGRKVSLKWFKGFIQRSQPDIESRLVVFMDLKRRGLIVKTGFKFGAHFRAYTKKPDDTHAEYLVHVVDKGFRSVWSDISRAVRLAHSVNKEIVFARVDDECVNYVRFGRLRP